MDKKPTYKELEQRVKELKKEVAKRKQADDALKESERRFRDISENALEWIWEVDINGKYTYASPVVKEILGYEPKEVLEKHFYDLFDPEGRQKLKKASLEVFSKKQSFREFINRNVHKDGKTVWLSTSGVPIFDKSGIFRGYRGADTDITERKQAEEKLQEMQVYLENLFNYANAPIIVWDPAFRITRFNHAFERLTGKRTDEVVGASLDILFPEDRRQEAMAYIRRTGEGERWEVVEIPILGADGTVHIVLWNSANIYAEDSTTVIATIAQGQDITERKRAEQAIRESEEKFKAITASAKDAIIMMDKEGKISYWNEAAENIFGYSAHEAVGKELHIFLAPQKYHDAYRQGILTFKGTGHGPAVGKTLELEALRKDGTRFPIELSVSAVKIEEKWHATGIVRDISQRKQAEEALRKAHDELEQRVEERTARLAKTTELLKVELAERKRVEQSLRQSEERFRSVAQTASDAIITVDSCGNIVFWNDAADKIFGYSSNEMIGKPLTYIMPERFKKDQTNGLERVVSTGHSGIIGKTLEKVGRRKNGREFPAELSIARWKTHEGVFFTGILRDITHRKRAEGEIRRLYRRLIGGIEEERKRLARDLHDELGQAVTALHFSLEALHNSLPGDRREQKTRCDELIKLTEQLGDHIRNISSELRPDMLDHLGLIPTLEWYIQDFVKRREGLRIGFKAIGVKKRPDPEIEIVLYRILQEALNNIAKHAKANHVSVLLTYSHPKLIFTIKDDGVGFGQTEGMVQYGVKKQGIGLLGMRERVASVQGNIDIRSSRGKGTLIRAELPVSLTNAEV